MRFPLVGGWDQDPAWAKVYPLLVEHPVLGAPLWRLGLDSDIALLYRAAEEIGELPAGARVLDVPVGGGVALRGLRPGGGLDYVAADISPTMLRRAEAAARRHDVADQVTTALADVGDLPFADGSFDMVVSFTGLHVFPDPRRAIHEMVRVLARGGVLTGSALFSGDFRGLQRRYALVHAFGRMSQVLGPMCTAAEARAWLLEAGADEVHLEMSGGLGYFRATKD
ncbi:class I SAM-dependent methyltransferase [Nocardioides seonyuensis]|uniref:Class I SAM-dependent methyltransferase n=1 Tax=Nocardioides seonyuensis TaxID=2518371 RepID=A0A4P7ID36_9ACTN|nr:class I SAM-dependent methyltransferase [Nocardioides seonyuensis]QBX54978.1 class I SAM-dependent methyltransferase [Nocardioides seonyuensis]